MSVPQPPTRRGVHQALAEAPPPTSGEVRLGHTLPLRVELLRQVLRRRTQVVAGLLTLLPVVLAIAFEIGGAPAPDNGPNPLVPFATHGAANFTLFIEFATQGFLMVVVVSLFAGDTVAGEANWSSLRYLLTAPVPRSRLLRQKLIVALGLAAAANVWLAAVTYLVGGLFFGWAPALTPTGAGIGGWDALGRLAVVIGFALTQAVLVAGFAFLFSVLTDAPLGAVGGAVLLMVISTILDSITALDPYRQYLPSHYLFAWLDALNTTILWDNMIRGAGLALCYAALSWAAAWWFFQRKDITS